MKKYDSIIIGFGKGGKTLAGYLATKGESVALIEKSNKMYGGTCINVGCIPSKSLIINSIKSNTELNRDFKEKSEFYKKAVIEKEKLTSFLRQKNFDKLDSLENVEIINGMASFVDKNTISISGEINESIYGDKIYINTGGSTVIPKIPGLENNPFIYFSDSMMSLETLPERMVIVGGGYIGLEFASMYSNFGAKVTVMQNDNMFIPREDEEIASEVKTILENKGINFIFNANITSFEKLENTSKVIYKLGEEEKYVEAEAILVAIGRKPNIEGLNLDKIGMELTERGAIKTNENLQTSISNIWAMGDVVGGLQFTYISLDDFRIIKNGIENKLDKNLLTRQNVPYSVFLDPPLSVVGITEKEAIKRGYNIKVNKIKAAAIPKAQVLQQPLGLLKTVVDADTNKILGASLLCEESYEMINIIKLAMDMNADYTVLRDQIFTHPTMSETLNDLFAF